MKNQFLNDVVIKNSGDRVSVSWQWGSAGNIAVDIYARKWDVDAGQDLGVFIQREPKLPGYALADVELDRSVIAGGIYHFIFLPVIDSQTRPDQALIVENIRVGRHPQVFYTVTDSRDHKMAQIHFSITESRIPAGHLQVVSRASQMVYPLMKEIRDKSTFLMYGEHKADIEVEAKACYKECYHISRG